MDWIMEACYDSLFVLPALFIANLIIEYFGKYLEKKRNTNIGPIAGGLLGLIPQCGFSSSISILYVNGTISYGALLASFIAINDEALLVLLANPDSFTMVFYLLLAKVIMGITLGLLYDKINTSSRVIKENIHHHDHKHESVLVESIKKTINIFIFILIVNVIFGFLMSQFESVISSFMYQHEMLQIIIAALIGFIPNCGAVLILAQLYIDGLIGYSVLFTGLVTYTGLGLVMLYKYGEKKKVYQTIVFLFILAILFGYTIKFIWSI